MHTWIALLRGINVGGKNILPMRTLRDLLNELGYTDIKTVIQSGNCVFRARSKSAKRVAADIAKAINTAFGFRPQVLCLTGADLSKAIASNPYRSAAANDGKAVHFYFLSEAAMSADLDALRALCDTSEAFELTDQVFYLLAPNGIGRSKVAARAEANLGVPVTARNFRTVQKLAALAG
ncbi:MAG: DUF1697 domain-containing protein [Pseudomonadota bacterium]